MLAVWIPIAVVVLLLVVLALYLWVTYTAIVALKARVDEAWSDIAEQLRRRADLLPKIVETVRGYATHEQGVFDAVTRARAESESASTPAEASTAENHVQQALKSVFAVAESYPQLQASRDFLQLQSELVDTEDAVQASRRFYNGGVREFNTKIQVFPNGIFARRLGFAPRQFFEVADAVAIAQPPRVQF